MSNLSQSITSLCHQLIDKPTNIKVDSLKSYQKGLDNALDDSSLPQEIVLSKMDTDFYVHLKANINIQLFKELNIKLNFNDMDNQIYNALKKESQVVKNGNRNHIVMQKGDIEIKFNNTPLSEKISEHKYIQKNGALIKGEDCFIEKSSPGGRDGDRYSLVQATQEDLKEILIGLTELL